MPIAFLRPLFLCTFVGMNKGMVLRGIAVPDWYLTAERELLELTDTMARLEEERKRLTDGILSRMEEDGISRIDSGLSVCSKVSGSVRHRLNVSRLRRDYPEIWKSCRVVKKKTIRHVDSSLVRDRYPDVWLDCLREQRIKAKVNIKII